MAIDEEGGGIGNVLKKHDASHNMYRFWLCHTKCFLEGS